MKGQVQVWYDGLGRLRIAVMNGFRCICVRYTLCSVPQWAFLSGDVGHLLGFVDQFALIQEELEWGLVGVRWVPGQGWTLWITGCRPNLLSGSPSSGAISIQQNAQYQWSRCEGLNLPHKNFRNFLLVWKLAQSIPLYLQLLGFWIFVLFREALAS